MQSALLLFSALGHYENPYLGPCASDEQSISITGITGKSLNTQSRLSLSLISPYHPLLPPQPPSRCLAGEFCSPACSAAGACPTDVPTGTTAKPTCDLNSPQGAKYCSLVCAGAGAAGCPTGASCKAIQGTGICTYDATPPGPTPPGPTPPGPTPPGPTPTPPTPTPPTPPGGAKWYMLPYRETIIIGVGVVSANTAYFAAGDNGIGAQVLKTTDGGSSFTPVPFNDSSPIPPLMILSAAAASEKVCRSRLAAVSRCVHLTRSPLLFSSPPNSLPSSRVSLRSITPQMVSPSKTHSDQTFSSLVLRSARSA